MVENDKEEDVIVSEGSEYTPKSDFSKGKVVEEAIKKCFDLRAKEMRSGYYNSKADKFGNITQEWISDSRMAFIASIIGLKSLLAPEILHDKFFKKEGNKIKEKMDACFKKYAYEERHLTEKSIEGSSSNFQLVWISTGNKFIPENNAEVCIVNPIKKRGDLVKGGWNNYIHAYWEKMLVLHDKLFAELNKLCAREKYFKTQMGGEDEE